MNTDDRHAKFNASIESSGRSLAFLRDAFTAAASMKASIGKTHGLPRKSICPAVMLRLSWLIYASSSRTGFLGSVTVGHAAAAGVVDLAASISSTEGEDAFCFVDLVLAQACLGFSTAFFFSARRMTL